MTTDTPDIITCQAGFGTADRKIGLFPDAGVDYFELQDMGQNATEALGAYENWKPVFRGPLSRAPGALGSRLVGDFSAWTKPGIYRLVLPGDAGRSWLFPIHDGVFSGLPRMFLDYLHANRCGDFSNDQRGPCHLDDGILSKSGRQINASGGWHDAGDTRKWMVHSTLPALALAMFKGQHNKSWNHFQDPLWQDDQLAEIAWGVRFILKMQDPRTGMIYEDVGGGGDSRKQPGMSWWYANHSGCCADNAQNRFTDNIPGSGDERFVREAYNPIVQYTNITILLRCAPLLEAGDPGLAALARKAAEFCRSFMAAQTADAFHGWTSVRSWRLLAALAAHAGEREIMECLDGLVELHDAPTGFWFNDTRRDDYFRGILHSAQPLIALTAWAEAFPAHARRNEIEAILRHCLAAYVEPLRATNPFGIIPFGLYPKPATEGDRYREWNHGLFYRFFMPALSPQRVNHGLGGHWTSWAHALAYAGQVFGIADAREAALDQIRWLLGNNPLHVSFVNGIGYNQPMPHSRFLGQLPGAPMIGPRGDANDEFYTDTMGRADWSTCEYWVATGGNMVMALSHLIPKHIPEANKLGHS